MLNVHLVDHVQERSKLSVDAIEDDLILKIEIEQQLHENQMEVRSTLLKFCYNLHENSWIGILSLFSFHN